MAIKPVAIVTGAGRGIGAAIACALHRDGFALTLMSPSGAAEKLAKELGGTGLTGSVTEPTDLARLVDETMKVHGRIDALVNNAGAPSTGELLEISDEVWKESHELSFLSVVRLCRLVTPVMVKQRHGAIVNISSYLSHQPDLEYPLSSVYRAALASFTKLYANRYGPDGIRMNSIGPGFMENWDFPKGTTERIPLRRFGTMEEIGALAAFLLSDAAGYLTGLNLPIDGGLTRAL
jgi:NAD(P)-dependent dehydrogenase (short-subunit alcohol dehydrogenase family)